MNLISDFSDFSDLFQQLLPIFIVVGGIPLLIINLVRIRTEITQAKAQTYRNNSMTLQHTIELIENFDQIGKLASELTAKGVLEDLENHSKDFLEEGKTGKQIYYSKEFTKFKTVCHNYERLGAYIKHEYFNFNIFFDITPFPDDFWDKSNSLREAIRCNWYGKNKGMSDFLENFQWLRKRYLYERKNAASPIKTIKYNKIKILTFILFLFIIIDIAYEEKSFILKQYNNLEINENKTLRSFCKKNNSKKSQSPQANDNNEKCKSLTIKIRIKRLQLLVEKEKINRLTYEKLISNRSLLTHKEIHLFNDALEAINITSVKEKNNIINALFPMSEGK